MMADDILELRAACTRIREAAAANDYCCCCHAAAAQSPEYGSPSLAQGALLLSDSITEALPAGRPEAAPAVARELERVVTILEASDCQPRDYKRPSLHAWADELKSCNGCGEHKGRASVPESAWGALL